MASEKSDLGLTIAVSTLSWKITVFCLCLSGPEQHSSFQGLGMARCAMRIAGSATSVIKLSWGAWGARLSCWSFQSRFFWCQRVLGVWNFGSRCGNVELRDSDNGVLLIFVWPFSSVKALRPWLRVWSLPVFRAYSRVRNEGFTLYRPSAVMGLKLCCLLLGCVAAFRASWWLALRCSLWVRLVCCAGIVCASLCPGCSLVYLTWVGGSFCGWSPSRFVAHPRKLDPHCCFRVSGCLVDA